VEPDGTVKVSADDVTFDAGTVTVDSSDIRHGGKQPGDAPALANPTSGELKQLASHANTHTHGTIAPLLPLPGPQPIPSTSAPASPAPAVKTPVRIIKSSKVRSD